MNLFDILRKFWRKKCLKDYGLIENGDSETWFVLMWTAQDTVQMWWAQRANRWMVECQALAPAKQPSPSPHSREVRQSLRFVADKPSLMGQSNSWWQIRGINLFYKLMSLCIWESLVWDPRALSLASEQNSRAPSSLELLKRCEGGGCKEQRAHGPCDICDPSHSLQMGQSRR